MLVTVVRFAGPAVLVLETLSCFDTYFILFILFRYKFYLICILYISIILYYIRFCIYIFIYNTSSALEPEIKVYTFHATKIKLFKQYHLSE